MSQPIVAADVGNSRIKLGLFADMAPCEPVTTHRVLPIAPPQLPEPVETLELALAHQKGEFDEQRLCDWCREVAPSAGWLLASVHRAAVERLRRLLSEGLGAASPLWVRVLAYSEMPIVVDLPEPQRVGIDRLAAASAANRLRAADRVAIVVDHGTAITVDVVRPPGTFVGGAILPGTALAARALADHTDALPLVAVEELHSAVPVVGNATIAAIEAGIYWGTYGAVRELVTRIATEHAVDADVFLTGGGAAGLAERLASDTGLHVRHVPHLVLAGIALAHLRPPEHCTATPGA